MEAYAERIAQVAARSTKIDIDCLQRQQLEMKDRDWQQLSCVTHRLAPGLNTAKREERRDHT
jgi:hypothetical protein